MTTAIRPLHLALALTTCCLAGTSQAAQLAPLNDFGDNPGGLKAVQYVPDDVPDKAGLVVVLHGCGSNPSDMHTNAGFGELADEYKIYLLYPQKDIGADMGCFNFGVANWQRGVNENLSMISMVDTMLRLYPKIDPKRVFITGVSAGGCFTSLMMAVYPERFAAAGIMEGGPYQGAPAPQMAAFGWVQNKTPQEWGDLVRAAVPGYGGPYPRLIVFHGSLDPLVWASVNDGLIGQWTNVHGVTAAPVVDQVGGAKRTRYMKDGIAVVELFEVPGMFHNVSVSSHDPEHNCGKQGGLAWDFGLCTAYWILKFFGLTGGRPDGGVPGDRPSAPPDGLAGVEQASSQPDASTSGSGPSSADSGCGCVLESDQEIPTGGLLAALILGLAGWAARRRLRRQGRQLDPRPLP